MITHRVQPHEGLSDIVRRYGVGVADMLEANRHKPRTTLESGLVVFASLSAGEELAVPGQLGGWLPITDSHQWPARDACSSNNSVQAPKSPGDSDTGCFTVCDQGDFAMQGTGPCPSSMDIVRTGSQNGQDYVCCNTRGTSFALPVTAYLMPAAGCAPGDDIISDTDGYHYCVPKGSASAADPFNAPPAKTSPTSTSKGSPAFAKLCEQRGGTYDMPTGVCTEPAVPVTSSLLPKMLGLTLVSFGVLAGGAAAIVLTVQHFQKKEAS